MMVEKNLKFTEADIHAFSDFCYDYNPIHCNFAYARKTFYGEQIVHGALTLLFCISNIHDEIEEQFGLPITVTKLRAEFHSPVFLEKTYKQNFEITRNKVKFDLTAQTGETLLRGSIHFISVDSFPASECYGSFTPTTNKPNILNETEIKTFSLSNFPKITHRDWQQNNLLKNLHLSFDVIYAISTSSYIIGMHCPGLYSIFTALKLNFTREQNTLQETAETKLYSHNLLYIQIKHQCFNGTIEAIKRPEPLPSPSVNDIKNQMDNLNFIWGKTFLLSVAVEA